MTKALTIVALLGGFAALASAQTIGKPAPDVKFSAEGSNTSDDQKDWFLIKRHEGHLVVMYFWRSTNLDSINTLKRMVELQEKYRPRGVRFIDFVAEKKEDTEKLIEERGLTRLENQIYGVGVKQLQELYGALSEPYNVIVDPRGIIRWRGSSDDRLEDRIEFYLKRYPPPAANDALLGGMLDQAEALVSAGEPGKAWTLAHKVAVFTENSGSPMNTRATGVENSAESKATEWLNQAIELEKQKKYDEAARIVAEISVRFDKGDERDKSDDNNNNKEEEQLQVKRDADQEIGRMNGVRELKEKIRDALKEARAQVVLDEAAALELAGNYETATQLYEGVIKNFEDTKSQKAAEAAITRIERDANAQKTIAENRKVRMGDQIFAIAEHYQHLEMYDEAREQYEKLIADYPNHDLVSWAKEAIKSMPTATAQR